MEPVPAASRAGSDRLSDLPDCLLHSVLSSLRSRQVVQTCLLSRRWRHLWRSVPCLDVDQRDFLLVDPEPEAPAADASGARFKEIKRQRRFEDFADAVLPLNGAWPLDAYRLHVAERDHHMSSYRWMRRGLARRPAELRVSYGFETRGSDVSFDFNYVSGGAGALPLTSRLRKLHLSGLTISAKFAEELGSECPVLEELKLVECKSDYGFSGRIASRSLRSLHIEGVFVFHGYNGLRVCPSLHTLDVPALVSLNLVKVRLPKTEDVLQSLAVASIIHPNKDVGQYRFLKSLRNARVLKLRSFTTTVRQSICPVIPITPM
jgi:hypothetical protein